MNEEKIEKEALAQHVTAIAAAVADMKEKKAGTPTCLLYTSYSKGKENCSRN